MDGPVAADVTEAVAVPGIGPVLTEVLPSVAVGYVLPTSALGTLAIRRAGRVERLVAPGGEPERPGTL